MGVAGNLEAIRDWVNRYFYKKSEVNEFFIKLNSGLKAYWLTIAGVSNAKVSIVENASTDTQSYNITLNENGYFTGLLFFHSGSTLSLEDDQNPKHAVVHELTSYKDEIIISGTYSIATPVMTSATTPSGEVLTNNNYSADYAAWKAFKQIVDNNGWVTATNALPAYIGYHFTAPKVISKFDYYNRNYNGTLVQIGAPAEFEFQASNDGINWITLGSYTNDMFVYGQKHSHLVQNDTAYTYYRVYITRSSNDTGKACACSRLDMFEIVQS